MAVAHGQSDAELLESFVHQHDRDAFESMVRRHGPMVLRVCQRVLRNASDADDAFQATFIVLSRKAAAVTRRQRLASWLYRVAFRIALKARASSRRRQAREFPIAEEPKQATAAEAAWRDLRPMLDEELDRLPAKYRAALVLCYLEGKTNDEAAEQLGCTRGTIAGQLARGRELLRDRLTRRGLALSGAVLGALLAQESAAAAVAVPAALVGSTVKAVPLAVAGKVVAGVASAQAGTLADAALKALVWAKIKFWTTVALALAAVGTPLTMYLARPNTAPVLLGAFEGHKAPVETVALSPDGKTLASGTNEKGKTPNTVRLWDVTTRRELFNHPMNAGVLDLVFSPDGKTVAAASGFQDVRLWDVASGQRRDIRLSKGSACICLAFSPDGKTLAEATLATTSRIQVKLWDQATAKLQVTLLWDGAVALGSVTFSADGQTFTVVGSESRANNMEVSAVCRWNVATRQRLAIPPAFRDRHEGYRALSPDGQTLATFDQGHAVMKLCPASGGQAREVPTSPPIAWPGSVRFSPSGKLLAAACQDGTVKIWNANIGELRGTLPGNGSTSARSLAFSADGKLLAVGREDGATEVWDVAMLAP